MIRPPACDGCFEDIQTEHGYIGMDVYDPPPDEFDDDEDYDPVNDEDYTHHFCSPGCVWAWACRQITEVVDG